MVALASIIQIMASSPERRQTVFLSKANFLSIGSKGTNFNESQSKIQWFSFRKMHKVVWKYRPFCSGLGVLNNKKLQFTVACSQSSLTGRTVCPRLSTSIIDFSGIEFGLSGIRWLNNNTSHWFGFQWRLKQNLIKFPELQFWLKGMR